MNVSKANTRDVCLALTKQTGQYVAAILAEAEVMKGWSGSSRSASSW